MFKDKKIVIGAIIILVLVLLVIIGLTWRSKNKASVPVENPLTNTTAGKLPEPEFLSVAEKNKLNISPDLKIQALGRNASGSVTVYKIIKTDSDVILDPSKIGSISPQRTSPLK
ncbi:MAG: hypothetical protein WC249_00535 [Patescibacteria group bacterium]